jgi:hypothetical protein
VSHLRQFTVRAGQGDAGADTRRALDAPQLRALMPEAARPCEDALRAAPALSTIVKTALARQRPRRPAPATQRRK